MRCAARVVLALSLLVTVGFGQSVAELLQKGIYTQNTIGNLDGAIQIYRQIIASAPNQREYAAQAQYQLIDCLIRKGDIRGAVQEFNVLARTYPERYDLTNSIAQRIHATNSQASTEEQYGWFKDGRVHNNWTGLEFTLPSDWAYVGQNPSSGAGQMVVLKDTTEKAQFAAVWMRKEAIPDAEKPKRLEWELSAKPQQRYWQDFKDYKIRPESVQWKTIGGNPAVVAVADYSGIWGQAVEDYRGAWGQKGATRRMTEYLVWICGRNTYVFFFARTTPANLAELQSRFDEIIGTAVIP